MNWPPKKAWTSTKLLDGYWHFVAINYGGQGDQRWVLLVSVLDGKSICVVKWKDICDPSQWESGWLELSEDQIDRDSREGRVLSNSDPYGHNSCLHASDDSGLVIPTNNSEIRPWF